MKSIIAACCLILLAALAGPAAAAEVSQGKCIQYDREMGIITIEEFDTQFSDQDPYGRPTGVEAAYDVSGAAIGITPEPGDILRLAYRVEGDQKVALRVMNVSKQDLRKK
jgi:opacity protein-like surface antigen